jgi:hypothetical protein
MHHLLLGNLHVLYLVVDVGVPVVVVAPATRAVGVDPPVDVVLVVVLDVELGVALAVPVVLGPLCWVCS